MNCSYWFFTSAVLCIPLFPDIFSALILIPLYALVPENLPHYHPMFPKSFSFLYILFHLGPAYVTKCLSLLLLYIMKCNNNFTLLYIKQECLIRWFSRLLWILFLSFQFKTRQTKRQYIITRDSSSRGFRSKFQHSHSLVL